MTHNEPTHKLTVKVGDALRTIQGYTLEEYRMARAELIDDLAGDVEAVQLAKGAGVAGPLVVAPTTATPAPAPVAAAPAPAGWDQPAAPAPTFASAAIPSCQHGPRTARGGVGAKGPWKAWFCPTPKGTPGQCDAVWVQKNTPEWANFPA